MKIKKYLPPLKIFKSIFFLSTVVVFFLGFVYLFKKNQELYYFYNKIVSENTINCPKIDNYFNLTGENKNFEKTKLLSIDTRITFRNPGSIAINTYKFTPVFSNREEATIEFIGLKEYNNGEYIPMIYDVKGNQNSSTVVVERLFSKNNYFYDFLSQESPNISISLNNNWYILSQSICNYGEICKQVLYIIDTLNKEEKKVVVPEKYILESILGYYNNKIVFKLNDDSFIQYDFEKNDWSNFSKNIKYVKLNSAENIIKKYGCFYIPAYQGDVVFYKHKLFSMGYPDFKWVDIFYNKK
ncbi:MAG: hypothetical protein Fur009_5220 [Candidatus Microgenomates bacterium]